ncbi:hypothetical protein DFQ26_002216 [Actinomortierella ambigua]|nr:hypothetical protein DFQ26_002216 [Actinomortierella ambigua]
MSQSHSTTAERDLEKCLELIRPGTSHEEKFVGLILMSKLLDDSEPETVRLFFDNMDHQFLDRMLKITTDQLPEGCGVDVQTVKAIAVNILTCFASNWELLTRKEFKDHLPALLTLISAKNDGDNTHNILRILLKISTYPQVSMVLTNPDYQRVVVSYILETMSNGEDEAHRDARLVCQRTFLIIQEGYKQNAQAVTDITRHFWPTILTLLSKPFSQPTEPHKPEILQLLIDTLSFVPDPLLKHQVETYPSESRAWVRNLKSGLIQLLSTRQEVRVLMDELGQGLDGGASDSTNASRDDNKQDTSKSSSSEETDRSLEKTREEKVLPLAYGILETTIAYLIQVADTEDFGLFDATAILKLQEALQATFIAILDYLRDVQV